MPIELLDDIVEELADTLSFYGAHCPECENGPRMCRCCWTAEVTQRIRNAVNTERLLTCAPESTSCRGNTEI
jgi:hypothetical protein